MATKLYQGFISLDKKDFTTDEEKAEYYKTIASFFIEFDFINQVNNRQLFCGLSRHPPFLEDKTNEETQETIPGFLSFVSDRFPVVLGMFNQDGTQYGTEKVLITPAEYDEEGNILTEAVYEIQGTPVYPFQATKYLNLMPDIPDQVDEEGNVLTWKRPTQCYPLRSFAGFKQPIFPQ